MSKISLKMPFWPRTSTVWRKTSSNWFINCGNLRRASISKISLKIPFWPRMITDWQKKAWTGPSSSPACSGSIAAIWGVHQQRGCLGLFADHWIKKHRLDRIWKAQRGGDFQFHPKYINNYYRIIPHITSSILTSSTSQNYNIFLVIHIIFIFKTHFWNFYHEGHILCQVKINQWPGMAQLGRKDNLFTASSF